MAVIAQGQAESTPATDTRIGTAARFPCFDGLRALAAFSVFAFHSAVFLHRGVHRYVPFEADR